MNKVTRFYIKLDNEVSNLIKLNPNRKDIKLHGYYIEDDSKNLYNELIKLVNSKMKSRKLDLRLHIISPEDFDMRNRKDNIILDYANYRLQNIY